MKLPAYLIVAKIFLPILVCVQIAPKYRDNDRIVSDSFEKEFPSLHFNKRSDGQSDDGTCEVYNGTQCTEYVGNQLVYIPHAMNQQSLEKKLKTALIVISYSKEISESCQSYTKPSICFSTFQICRNNTQNSKSRYYFDMLNDSPLRKARELAKRNNDIADRLSGTISRVPRYTYSSSPEPGTSKIISESYGNVGRKRDFNHKLRRICREECELLENDLCRNEYAIAKRHPIIGGQLPLIECTDLPLPGTKEAMDCLSVGISTESDINEKEYCYLGTGVSYRGTVKTSTHGRPCLKWDNQLIYDIGHYGLSGKHSFCRNPRGDGEKPWCYVTINDKIQKEYCDIPECVKNLWIYTATGLVLTVIIIVAGISYCYFYKNKKLIGQSNFLASNKIITGVECDANIYDGKKVIAQPIEMSSLLAGPSNLPVITGTLGKSSTSSRSSEGNRVPQFSVNDVTFLQELGEGAFGKVYKGELKVDNKSNDRVFVAVKTLKENASIKTLTDFKREVELMSDLRHPNIICLIGVVFSGEPMCMLFEYMTEGDLHEFLIRHSPKSENAANYENLHVLKQPEFLYISMQISAGMEYLASNHYVHRDLAARNCLVGDNLTVKISDFGLSRDIYSSDYYRVQSKSLLPVRWMPPESILYGKFTTESDVWSFGVVLWEIFSYGLQPYYGYNNQEVIDMIRSRQLLPCPEDCPPAVYTLMTQCWHEIANLRPPFSEVHKQLTEFFTNIAQQNSFRKENSIPLVANSIHASPITNSVHASPIVQKKDVNDLDEIHLAN